MDAEPRAFNTEMRGRMQEHLAASQDEPQLALRYAQGLPVEQSRLLGFFVWSIASLNQGLAAGRADHAELLSLRLLAALEQSMLDRHWQRAWGVTGLPEPAWPGWSRTSLQTHRKTHTSSPLLLENWVAMAIQKTKDEQFLRRNRNTPSP